MTAYLFDTDAISEVLRPKPSPRYIAWLRGVLREEQFASAVTVGELYAGAYRGRAHARHLRNIREHVLPRLTVVPYDTRAAETYGRIRAALEDAGQRLADADLQIAATALTHGMTLVTGNVRHFARVPGLAIESVLADSRR